MKYRVVMTPSAEDDLRAVYHYIRKRGAPSAARVWLARMRKSIKSLTRNPERAPFAPERASLQEPIRELLLGSANRGTYRILFTVMENALCASHPAWLDASAFAGTVSYRGSGQSIT
ncbi:MAG: type II toxin-antitoxin system RelE/ParE family toxin [Acidobacteriota bacterium]